MPQPVTCSAQTVPVVKACCNKGLYLKQQSLFQADKFQVLLQENKNHFHQYQLQRAHDLLHSHK